MFGPYYVYGVYMFWAFASVISHRERAEKAPRRYDSKQCSRTRGDYRRRVSLSEKFQVLQGTNKKKSGAAAGQNLLQEAK